jgi:nicotinamidase-related amidase
MAQKTRLLIIDPQADFCDGPAGAALPVPGAWDDMSRLARLIDRMGSGISDIDVTLDTHHALDIAHAAWWQNREGVSPPPFTLITAETVEGGAWRPRNPAWHERSLQYVRQLAANRRYALMIWPTHCLLGSPGHAVQPELLAALRRWEETGQRQVNFVIKGMNPFTEHYSAIAAEVPDAGDPGTMLNLGLIERLRESEAVLVAGEALSHCVKATVSDIADHIGAAHVGKFVLLTDCSSPVPAAPGGPDFPALGRAFVAAMVARGMRVADSLEV